MDLKEKKVLDAISGIDDKFIEEAADFGSVSGGKNSFFTKKNVIGFVSAAASIALIILGGNALRMSMINGPAESTERAVTMQSLPEEREVADASAAPGEMIEAAPSDTEESMPAPTEESAPSDVSISILENDGATVENYTSPDKQNAESGICIPAMGYAVTPYSSETDDGKTHTYEVTLYGLFDESDIREGATGYYENGYGELSMTDSYEQILSEEAKRLSELGIEAMVYAACGRDYSEYGLTVNLTGEELKNFPCSENYGYTFKLTE